MPFLIGSNAPNNYGLLQFILVLDTTTPNYYVVECALEKFGA